MDKQLKRQVESEWDGSIYEGPIFEKLYQGFGTLIFSNGIKYAGTFNKGEFEGSGTLIYPDGGVFTGLWRGGRIVDGTYTFPDQLKYERDNWSYLDIHDKRFYSEIRGAKKAPLRVFPKMVNCYQCSDDTYFDPNTNFIFGVNNHSRSRLPKQAEISWILDKCKILGENKKKFTK